MSTLTPDTRKTEWVYQPQLTRFHHAYRSPLNSERMNLQQQQLAYDIKNLYNKISNLIFKVTDQLGDIYRDGVTISETWTRADGSNWNFVLPALNTILITLAQCQDRLDNLERLAGVK